MICLWKDVAVSACKDEWVYFGFSVHAVSKKLKVNVCKMDNCAGRVFCIACASCCLEYKCVCPSVLAILF